MHRIIQAVILSLLFNSCSENNNDINDNFDYYKFAQQVTPSGQYVIYDYARFGPLAFSSDVSATEVFPINEEFKEGKGIEIEGSISEWLSNDTLLVYNFNSDLERPLDTLPIKTDYRELGDFIVKTVYYKTNSAGRALYKFDSVWFSDNLIFVKVFNKNNNELIIEEPLGATFIEATSDSIIHIYVNTRLTKTMSFVYKNSDGSFTTDLPGIGVTQYDLTPIKKIDPTKLMRTKVFWELKE